MTGHADIQVITARSQLKGPDRGSVGLVQKGVKEGDNPPFTAATVTVSGESWTEGAAGQRKQSRQGEGGRSGMSGMQLRQTESPHTPVSNEINASKFSGARSKSDKAGSTTDEADSEVLILLHEEQQQHSARAQQLS